MRAHVEISHGVVSEILSHCERELPYEACGLLGGKGNRVEKVVPAGNESRSRTEYSIDPAFVLRAMKGLKGEGLDVTGVYHSHPDGLEGLSARDVEECWEDFYYILVVMKGVSKKMRCYRVSDGREEVIEMRFF
ncbi:MAG: M67 family metallopeptidase [bacterium]